MANTIKHGFLSPMDIYATHKVPFDLATYCRGHKFSLAAVELSKALKEMERVGKLVSELEAMNEHAQDRLDNALKEVRKKMNEQDDK